MNSSGDFGDAAPLADVWFYPVRKGETLANNDWVEFHVHRFLGSSFVAHSLRNGRREDIATAIFLWSECYRQDPAGTLPDDDVELAQLARYGTDVEAWLEVRASVLHGWEPCLIETEHGDARAGRLGHPFIAAICERGIKRRAGRAAGREAARLSVTRSRIKKVLAGMAGFARLAQSSEVIDAMARWLDENGLFITEDNVRAAAVTVAGARDDVVHPFIGGRK